MKSRMVNVTACNGEHRPAQLVICPSCDGVWFSIFFLDADHQHLQCLSCGTSFCDGKCELPTAAAAAGGNHG
jgi:hypothetical protein